MIVMDNKYIFFGIGIVVVVAIVGAIFFNDGAQYSPKILEKGNVVSDSDIADLISNGVMLSGSESGNWRFADDVKIEIIDDSTARFRHFILNDDGKGDEVMTIRTGLISCDDCPSTAYDSLRCDITVNDNYVGCNGCCDKSVTNIVYGSIDAKCKCDQENAGDGDSCFFTVEGACMGGSCCKVEIVPYDV